MKIKKKKFVVGPDEKPQAQLQIRKVDYEKLAKDAGEHAYKRAIDNGCSKKEARQLRKIMGARIPDECRFS